MEIGIFAAFLGGIISFLSPCVLPLVPPYLAYLGGTTLDQISGDDHEIDPAASRENLAGILQAAKEAEVPVLMFSMAAPGNYGPDYKRDFDGMYPALAKEFGVLLGPDFLSPLMEAAGSGGFGDLMQADGIHPSANGVSILVEGLGPVVLTLLEQVQAEETG